MALGELPSLILAAHFRVHALAFAHHTCPRRIFRAKVEARLPLACSPLADPHCRVR